MDNSRDHLHNSPIQMLPPSPLSAQLQPTPSHLRKFNEVCSVTTKTTPYADQYYGQVKTDAESYQFRKKQLVEGLDKNGYGTWVGKPQEMDQFRVAMS